MKATIPSYDQIKRGLRIYEQIEQLRNELANLFGVKSADSAVSILSGAEAPKRRGRPPKSVAVVAAKRGRKKAETASADKDDAAPVKRRGRPPEGGATPKKAKRTISEAHRQAIKEAQQRRWAAKRGE